MLPLLWTGGAPYVGFGDFSNGAGSVSDWDYVNYMSVEYWEGPCGVFPELC